MVHYFSSTREAYDKSQCGYTKYTATGPSNELRWADLEHGVEVEVKDGDIMVVANEKVVGFMYSVAWPVALTEAYGEFGVPTNENSRRVMEEEYPLTFEMYRNKEFF
jgi:hypothetical protein